MKYLKCLPVLPLLAPLPKPGPFPLFFLLSLQSSDMLLKADQCIFLIHVLQLLVLSKAGVIHEVLLSLGPRGLEVDTTHPIQDAFQGLDISAPELLGLLLESHRIQVRQGWEGR